MNKKNEGTILGFAVAGVFAVIVALLIIIPVVNGFFVSLFWEWFVTKPFGIRPISLAEAIGLSYLIYAFRGYKHTSDGEFKNVKWYKIVSSYIFWYIFMFIFAWIVHLFV